MGTESTLSTRCKLHHPGYRLTFCSVLGDPLLSQARLYPSCLHEEQGFKPALCFCASFPAHSGNSYLVSHSLAAATLLISVFTVPLPSQSKTFQIPLSSEEISQQGWFLELLLGAFFSSWINRRFRNRWIASKPKQTAHRLVGSPNQCILLHTLYWKDIFFVPAAIYIAASQSHC